MEYTPNTNVPTLDAGKICCAAPKEERPIKDSLMETTEILTDMEAQVNRIKNLVWISDEDPAPNIDIFDLNSNVVRNLEVLKRIYKKLTFIADRLGC